jgi:hypothetical protein
MTTYSGNDACSIAPAMAIGALPGAPLRRVEVVLGSNIECKRTVVGYEDAGEWWLGG